MESEIKCVCEKNCNCTLEKNCGCLKADFSEIICLCPCSCCMKDNEKCFCIRLSWSKCENNIISCFKDCCVKNKTCCDLSRKLSEECICRCVFCVSQSSEGRMQGTCCKIENNKIVCLKECCIENKSCSKSFQKEKN